MTIDHTILLSFKDNRELRSILIRFSSLVFLIDIKNIFFFLSQKYIIKMCIPFYMQMVLHHHIKYISFKYILTFITTITTE